MYIPKPLKAVPVAVILKLSMVKYFVPKKEMIGVAELCMVFPFPFKVMVFVDEVPEIFPKVSVSLYGPELAATFIVTAPLTPTHESSVAKKLKL